MGNAQHYNGDRMAYKNTVIESVQWAIDNLDQDHALQVVLEALSPEDRAAMFPNLVLVPIEDPGNLSPNASANIIAIWKINHEAFTSRKRTSAAAKTALTKAIDPASIKLMQSEDPLGLINRSSNWIIAWMKAKYLVVTPDDILKNSNQLQRKYSYPNDKENIVQFLASKSTAIGYAADNGGALPESMKVQHY